MSRYDPSSIPSSSASLDAGSAEGGLTGSQIFTTFTAQDGLTSNIVWSIFQDRNGVLWFDPEGGVSRYDGQAFATLTTKDGLAHDSVGSIVQDRDEALWFGTRGGGVSRYCQQR